MVLTLRKPNSDCPRFDEFCFFKLSIFQLWFVDQTNPFFDLAVLVLSK